MGVAYYWNQVVYGAILLGALILNAVVVARSRRRSTSAEEAPDVAGELV